MNHTFVAGKPARAPRRTPIAASLIGLFGLAGATTVGLALAAAPAVVAPLPANALPIAPRTEPGTTAIGYTVKGNSGVITQTAPTSIVTWNSFDIGAAASVTVKQPSSNAVLLNKVEGGAQLGRTTIDGMLNANGRVYIYNPNGIVFGKTSQVNVNTLMASSLRFDEERVIGGLLKPGKAPVLDADRLDAGAVIVDGGAALTAVNGGTLLLAAPRVINNGHLAAADGQVMLAAGNKVYLTAPAKGELTLRGLMVEVSDDNLPVDKSHLAPGTSLAENGGSIDVGRGNATMIGYAVNQNGTVSASTSVNLNGSIYLYARDHALSSGAGQPFKAQRSGQLVLGEGSVTQVLPMQGDDASIPLSTTFNRSTVALEGNNIELRQNARITAPGGKVTITAERRADNLVVDEALTGNALIDPLSNASRVDFAPGSSIDVAGMKGAVLPMESNVITVDLRSTELADNVVLRDSPLYATKVQVDIRNGASAAGSAANVAGWLALVEHKIGEVNTAGGSVTVLADGAIIARAGSSIKVDGGYVDYQGGYVNTTKFKLNDVMVDIGSASANTLYSGTVTLPNGVDNYEAGYRQGSSAGTVKFNAPIVVLQGEMSGQTSAGVRQRDVSAASFPSGGKFELGTSDSGVARYAGNVVLEQGHSVAAPQVGKPFNRNDADQLMLASRLQLDPALLASEGFSSISALTSGNIEVNVPVTLAAGGKLELSTGNSQAFAANAFPGGGNVNINGSVSIPGGSVTAAANKALQVADGVDFDLAGRWTNDRVGAAVDAGGRATAPFALNGGVLNLSTKPADDAHSADSTLLKIGNNVSADVSAGAWYDAGGKTVQGKAGSIAFKAAQFDLGNGPTPIDDKLNLPLPTGPVLQLGSGLALAGYGFGGGGTLTLVGKNVSIGAPVAGALQSDLNLLPSFFEQGGFSNYDVQANVNLDVQANTRITPRSASWLLQPNPGSQASAAMDSVATANLFDLSGTGRIRPATNLTLRALAQPKNGSNSSMAFSGGALTVGEGAQVVLDPGASLNLLAGEQLTVNGTLNAAGGKVTLALSTVDATPDRAERSIWFGPRARVLANGTAQRLQVSADGIATGDLLDGGTIRVGNLIDGAFHAAKGYVVAEEGALFDVSGASAGVLAFKSATGVSAPQRATSSAGSIEIRTLNGLLFEGSLRGAAGGVQSAAGALTIALEGSVAGALTVASMQPPGGIVPNKLRPGQAIVEGRKTGSFLVGSSSGDNARPAGQGWILDSAFSGGGFGSLTLKSPTALSFGLGTADLSLSASKSLTLDAPLLRADDLAALTTVAGGGHKLTLSAPTIRLGNADPDNQRGYLLPGEIPVVGSDPDPVKVKPSIQGNAKLVTSGATTIDVIGNSGTQGFGDVNLAAKADIRLVGVPAAFDNGVPTNYAPGSLQVTGNLTLASAQTYPSTLSDFTLSVAHDSLAPASSGRLAFVSNGNAAGTVLSAGGSVTALATDIVQDGRLLAPFGALYLGDADTRSLSYSARSVTSVAGAGVVPFGTITNSTIADASEWLYGLNSPATSFKLNPDPAKPNERALPAKAIVSHAQSISTSSGAVLDLSGGGTLSAYAFEAGKGGSRDVLSAVDASGKSTVWAVNPDFHGAVAPLDAETDGAGLAPGASIYLSGVPGLAAGTYTLLPAHYALLPGGFSVSVAPNTRDLQASGNVALQDGSMLVAGQLDGSARSNGFIVSSGKVLRTKSQFAAFDATTFFTAKAATAGVAPPELPADGGRLAMNVGGSGLKLDGAIRLGAASGGRAGFADFTSATINIVSSRGQGGSGGVQLVADDLTALGADSILIGALRESRGDTTHLSALASQVTLSNDAAHPLSGAEVLLAAVDRVRLDGGAVIRASGKLARPASDIVADGGGALLRASSGAAAAIEREGNLGSTGTLDIASGATVAASGSVYLDGSGGVQFLGKLELAGSGAFGIGAPAISLGSSIPLEDKGARFDGAALAMLSGLSQLSFNSYDAPIKLYSTVKLGGAGTDTLSFKGAGLQAYGADRQAILTAGTVRFDGPLTAATVAPAAPAAGALTVQAGQIDIGKGAFAIHGYSDSVLAAGGALQAAASGGSLSADHNLTLAASHITTAAGADAGFLAGEKLSLAALAAPAPGGAAAGLGGKLSFGGATIVSNAVIEAPSGQVLLSATNALDVIGGRIDVAGGASRFGSATAYAPAGQIALGGATVTLGTAATLDVSAIGASAGGVAITTTGAGSRAVLNGTLKGDALPGSDGGAQTQGQFTLDSDQAGGAAFGALNAQLNQAGFTDTRQFRIRNGNVALGGADLITAHDVLIAVDNGNITVDGSARINAAGSKGGSIALYASQGKAGGPGGRVTLAGNASLLANATGTPDGSAGSLGNGGRVVIGTSSVDAATLGASPGPGTIDLAGGSIDVSGSNAERVGSVTLRAPRVNGSEVAIARLGSAVAGAAPVVIEAYQVYNGSTISAAADNDSGNLDATTRGRMYRDASAFADFTPAILARLGAANLSVHPGIEVRAPGKLTVSVNEFAAKAADRGWDLHAWRFGAAQAPVELTLRAGGDLAVLGSISDGFIKPAASQLSLPDWQLGSGASAGYRIVGGADAGAANPLAVTAGAGDVLFGFAGRTPTSAAPLTATDAPVALVRTGTGRIDVAAGRDITLAMADFFTNHDRDPAVDGTPVIYDKHNGSSYYVTMYGASVYTAGQARAQGDGLSAPLNALNTHYGAKANTLTSAAFASGGGAISLLAGRDIKGPSNLDSKWYYRNDGTAAVEADPDTGIPAEAAIPGEIVYLPRTVPQLVNNWLFRQGRSYLDAKGKTVFETTADGRTLNTAWWSRPDYFDQGVATLGGGDVRVQAGGSITDLSVSAATNARASQPGLLVEQGGGDLLVRAGADIRGGALYVQKGSASVHAAGSITAGNAAARTDNPDDAGEDAPLNLVLAMGDASFNVSAGRDLAIESVFNPTLTAQSVNNVRLTNRAQFGGAGSFYDMADTTEIVVAKRQEFAQYSSFSTYGANSAVKLAALGGDLTLSNNVAALSLAAGLEVPNKNIGSFYYKDTFDNLYVLAPANYSAVSFGGGLKSLSGFTLMAAPFGQLDLLAAHSIALHNGPGNGIRMLDNDPAGVFSASRPSVFSETDLKLLHGEATGIGAHLLDNLHGTDTVPVHLIARSGDIVGDGSAALTLSLPKPAEIAAGRDIVDLGFNIQHNDAANVTSIVAGRDVVDVSSSVDITKNVGHVLTGPGRIDLAAGRNVDLGAGAGLVTRGNLENPYLPEGGASINVMAGGVQPDYRAFVAYAKATGSLAAVATSVTAMTAADRGDLLAYLAKLRPGQPAPASDDAALAAFGQLSANQQQTFLSRNVLALQALVQQGLPADAAPVSAADAWLALRAMPAEAQAAFLAAHPAIGEHVAANAAALDSAVARGDKGELNRLFFADVVASGQATKLDGFDKLIASLLPVGSSKGGNIALYNSQIKTEQVGSIDLFAPTGSVYAGLTASVDADKAPNQGIFTIRGGALRALVKTDFQVNQGRVFTLGGGDITLVSQYGSIDAGKGAKTAASAPPPLIRIDANGIVTLDVSGSISGSGIATLSTHPGQPLSNVYLTAPRGIVDAGDAGVRSTGTTVVNAPVVLNAANITAAGGVTGASAAAQAPVVAPVSAPAGSGARSDEGAKALDGGADAAAKSSALAVEVLGYGDDDEESPDDDEETRKRKKEKQKDRNKSKQQKST